MSSKLDILKAAEQVKPIAEVNGIPYVSAEDGEIIRSAAVIEGEPDFPRVKFNPDGSVARSRTDCAVVNAEIMYQNRFRNITDKDGNVVAVQVIVDPQAIATQTSGSVYARRITAYEFIREGKNLKLKAVITVSEDEFVREFDKTLAVRDMELLLPLIQGAGSDTTRENLAI